MVKAAIALFSFSIPVYVFCDMRANADQSAGKRALVSSKAI